MDQVQIEMALDKNFLVPDKAQKAYLMVKLTAPELVGTKRPKQNLSFVIYRSGSMHGDKLNHMKKAVAFAVWHLGKEDLCSVIAFDERRPHTRFFGCELGLNVHMNVSRGNGKRPPTFVEI